MQIINKFFDTADKFKSYVDSVDITKWKTNENVKNRLLFPVVHNTSAPTQALYKSWHDRKGWTQEQWGKNLASYYAGLGWNGCSLGFSGAISSGSPLFAGGGGAGMGGNGASGANPNGGSTVTDAILGDAVACGGGGGKYATGSGSAGNGCSGGGTGGVMAQTVHLVR